MKAIPCASFVITTNVFGNLGLLSISGLAVIAVTFWSCVIIGFFLRNHQVSTWFLWALAHSTPKFTPSNSIFSITNTISIKIAETSEKLGSHNSSSFIINLFLAITVHLIIIILRHCLINCWKPTFVTMIRRILSLSYY